MVVKKRVDCSTLESLFQKQNQQTTMNMKNYQVGKELRSIKTLILIILVDVVILPTSVIC